MKFILIAKGQPDLEENRDKILSIYSLPRHNAKPHVRGSLFHYKFSTAKYERVASRIKPDIITIIRFNVFNRSLKTPLLPLRQLKPHPSIYQVEFAKQYNAHKLWWDKAFAYLKNTHLASLTAGDHAVVGEDVFARVTEGPLKKIDSSKWEAHKNYADILLVIRGREKIGIGPLSAGTLVVPYISTRDISFYTGTGKYYTAVPGTYFIAFTHQIHRPGLQVEGKESEKKVVIKIRTSN